MDWLGFRYLQLRRFARHDGTLAAPASSSEADAGVGVPHEVEALAAAGG
jgi:hypothetical protein